MLGVRLTESIQGRDVELALGLPSHARERVVAAAHAEAGAGGGVAEGVLPNDGRQLDDARVTVTGSGEESALVVEVGAGGRSFARRFDRLTLFDDVSALVGQLLASRGLAAGSYGFALVELPEPPVRPAPCPRTRRAAGNSAGSPTRTPPPKGRPTSCRRTTWTSRRASTGCRSTCRS